MAKVGILGGGQLGAMLLESIYKLGADAAVFDPDADAPALRRSAFCVNAAWSDLRALDAFLASCDVVTYEFENVESSPLRRAQAGTPIYPCVDVLELTQDRVREKMFMKEQMLPHAHFSSIIEPEAIEQGAVDFGFPSILKTARGGYDGKGQFFLASRQDAARAAQDPVFQSGFAGAVLEEVVAIELEASCIVARSRQGEETAFPVFENSHSEHILNYTLVPARLSTAVTEAVQELAATAARQMGVIGLLTAEFFLSRRKPARSNTREVDGWHILINEFAPRPHNSGHVTRNACTFSQFDALARVLLDVPLSRPQILAPGYFCMANLLGDIFLQKKVSELDLNAWRHHANVLDVVLYGKKEARHKRKMGHIIAHGATAGEAVASALGFREALLL